MHLRTFPSSVGKSYIFKRRKLWDADADLLRGGRRRGKLRPTCALLSGIQKAVPHVEDFLSFGVSEEVVFFVFRGINVIKLLPVEVVVDGLLLPRDQTRLPRAFCINHSPADHHGSAADSLDFQKVATQ